MAVVESAVGGGIGVVEGRRTIPLAGLAAVHTQTPPARSG